MKIRAVLSNKRIALQFPYDQRLIKLVKEIPGSSWSKKQRQWTVPKDLEILRRLRDEFNDLVTLTPEVRAWANRDQKTERYLQRLGQADDAELPVLKELAPELHDWYRPHQRKNIAFLATTNGILADEGGLGKTAQAVGAVIERGSLDGMHLVIGTSAGLRDAWWEELVAHQPFPIILADEKTDAAMAEADELMADGKGFWFLVNAESVRTERVTQWLQKVNWSTAMIDEFHKFGMNNEKTIFFQAVHKLKADHRILISGTPYMGRPAKLFNALQWIHPERFTSRWTWIDLWMETTSNGFGKDVGGVRPGLEKRFWAGLSRYMVRCLFAEVYPEYPKTVKIEVKCDMGARQREQYRRFERDSELFVAGRNKVVDNIMSQYAELFKLAFSSCSLSDTGKFKPTRDSGKLRALKNKLEEQGIFDKESDSKVVIAAVSRPVLGVVRDWLEDMGVECEVVVGGVKKALVKEAIDRFQKGDSRVMLITTKKGGISITLDQADCIHCLDESWDPSDEDQLAWRIRRLSRVHSTFVYIYRSRDTVDEYRKDVVVDKKVTTENILDVHRQIQKSRQRRLEAKGIEG